MPLTSECCSRSRYNVIPFEVNTLSAKHAIVLHCDGVYFGIFNLAHNLYYLHKVISKIRKYKWLSIQIFWIISCPLNLRDRNLGVREGKVSLLKKIKFESLWCSNYTSILRITFNNIYLSNVTYYISVLKSHYRTKWWTLSF